MRSGQISIACLTQLLHNAGGFSGRKRKGVGKRDIAEPDFASDFSVLAQFIQPPTVIILNPQR